MSEHDELRKLRDWCNEETDKGTRRGHIASELDSILSHFPDPPATDEKTRNALIKAINRYCGDADVGKGAEKTWTQWVGDFADSLIPLLRPSPASERVKEWPKLGAERVEAFAHIYDGIAIAGSRTEEEKAAAKKVARHVRFWFFGTDKIPALSRTVTARKESEKYICYRAHEICGTCDHAKPHDKCDCVDYAIECTVRGFPIMCTPIVEESEEAGSTRKGYCDRHPDTKIVNHELICGAPQCCPKCCKEAAEEAGR